MEQLMSSGFSVESLEALLPIIVPAVLSLIRRLIPQIPRRFLPFAAAGLGILGQIIMAIMTGLDVDPAVGAALGTLGVGVREMADQGWSGVTRRKSPKDQR